MAEIDLNTFSIVAREPETGRFGIAVATKALGVGALCPFAKGGVGAVVTQARVNPTLGPRGLQLLEHGLSADEVVTQLLANDPGREYRQLAVIDKHGHTAAWTGSGANEWRGHIAGDQFSVQGNLLAGEEVVQAVVAGYKGSNACFEDRLMQAMHAGQKAGGDKRGKQSAALLVVDIAEYPYVDLRVDDSPDPLKELQRLWEIHKIGLASIYHEWVKDLQTGHVPNGIAKEDEKR